MKFSFFRLSFLAGVMLSFGLLFFAFFIFFTLYQEATFSFSDINERIYGLLWFTLYQASLSTFISLVVGVTLAWALVHQSSFKGREILIAILSSSLVLPTLIVVFGLIGIYGKNGYLNQLSLFLFDKDLGGYIYGLGGILVAHVYLNASFASRAILQALSSIPKEKYKLAKSLNFSLIQRFYYVEYPAVKATLLGIGTTIFLLCFTSFSIVLLLGGNPSYNTLEVAIYEAVKLDFDIEFALKLALIQLFISSILVIASSFFKLEVSNLQVDKHFPVLKELKIVALFQYAIITLFSLFFISPLVVIFIQGIDANFTDIIKQPMFIKSLYTSLTIATLSSIISLFFIIVLSASKRNLSSSLRLKKRAWSPFLTILMAFSSNIYLSVSSLIIGLGFFLLSLNENFTLFFWSSFAVISANVLLSLPFGISILSPLMEKTATRYDRVSFSLGLNTWERWKFVEYPYLKSSIGYILALSFCFSLGDFGVISLFGSETFTTLPWYLYSLMGSYQTNDASGVALIILGIVLIVFIFVPKLFHSSK